MGVLDFRRRFSGAVGRVAATKEIRAIGFWALRDGVSQPERKEEMPSVPMLR
jgi:hypothetical protein